VDACDGPAEEFAGGGVNKFGDEPRKEADTGAGGRIGFCCVNREAPAGVFF
jgi:hypothetical protein